MKLYCRFYMVIVFGILLLFGAFTVLSPAKLFSENENRYMEQFPKISLHNILTGEFQDDFEEAFSDQFPGRDIWMFGTAAVEKAAGFEEQNGVYLGRDGYFLKKITQEDIDQKQYLQNLRYVEYLGDCQKDKTSLLLVPSPGTILESHLPSFAPYYNADAMYKMAETILKRSKLVDSRAELVEYGKQNQIYYKTDHHWTLLGAYAAYSAYCDVRELKKHTYGYFTAKKISEDFLGTMYSKVMLPGTKKDTMYAASNIPQAELVCDGEEKSGIYDVEKLTQKDKYGYFFGGNYGKAEITVNNDSDKKLLVIKDSYANSFVPFLMEDYHEITMLDLRYYRDSVQKLVKDDSYNEILVLYEMSGFAEDKNLYKLVY